MNGKIPTFWRYRKHHDEILYLLRIVDGYVLVHRVLGAEGSERPVVSRYA